MHRHVGAISVLRSRYRKTARSGSEVVKLMTSSEGRFSGKIAVVTGGASGIGAAVCRRLIAEGASVVAGDINGDSLAVMQSELGTSFVGVPTDVAIEADVENMVNTAVHRFGGLHLGFNIAGTARGGSIREIELDDYMFTIRICQAGVLLGIKHESNAIIRTGNGGAIVNIASLNSRVPMFGAAGYCSAKAAAHMLTQVAALELAEYNIRVNTVSPGLTATPMTSPIAALPGVMDAYMDRIPLNRPAQPEEIAASSLYLASDDASYISGINLFVDGAWEQTGYPDLRPFQEKASADRSTS